MISKKTTVRDTVRMKLMRVLKRRKTPIGTKELAMKAGVNYNSAKDELRRMYHAYDVEREIIRRTRFWRAA